MAALDPAQHEALLERLRLGDEHAFDLIFRTWYAPLVQFAERMLREREAAEETVQDVMLELWKRRETLVIQGSPQAYLFQSTRNRALNRLRHLRVENREEFDTDTLPATSNTDASASEQEIEAALRSAIESLPPRCRQVFEMNRMQGLKYAEVAGALGISVKAVEAHMARALRTLRERLAPWLPRGRTL
ncbi:MAG: RNA polymerase sigma-70 factor [Gemmatimonadaceae bacterium]|nr:RNA polymerase sigma-70 factor [Gemmatimonadaceae bacterium]